MNGTTHTVTQLSIEFRKLLRDRDACFGFSSNSSVLYNVPNDERLNGLVLRHVPSSVHVVNWLYTAVVLYSITVVWFWFWFVYLFCFSSWSQDPKENMFVLFSADFCIRL